MKKLFAALILCAFMVTGVAAYEMKGAYYFGPYVGYKIFDDDDSELENEIEAGLKLGYFITEHWAAELSAGYTDAEYENKNGSEDVFTPGLHAVYHFRPSIDKALLPFLQAGVEARVADETDTGLAVGGGLKYLFTKNFAGDVSYKNIYFGGGEHDQLIAFSVAYFFGVKEKAPAKAAEPAPAPAPVAAAPAEEPAPAPAAVEEKSKETMAVAAAPVDSDGDGVYDDQDLCPGTPKGYAVNEKGCFKSMKLLVNFATNSDVIDADGMAKIQEFADFMKATPVLMVEIQGHTDSKGSDVYNQKLSEKRAKAVAAALVKLGVESERITSKGYGETKPVASNETVEGRAENRRIEAVALDAEGDKVKSQKPE